MTLIEVAIVTPSEAREHWLGEMTALAVMRLELATDRRIESAARARCRRQEREIEERTQKTQEFGEAWGLLEPTGLRALQEEAV